MPDVKVYVKNAEGIGVVGALVRVRARGAGNSVVYKNGGAALVGDVLERTGTGGLATFTLDRNTDLIPTTSYYEAILSIDNQDHTALFRMPAVGAGPFDFEDLLIEEPGEVNSAALDAHVETVGHHADVDLTGVATGEVLMWDGAKLVPADVGTAEAEGLVTAHNNDTTAVHGIGDTALLETIEGAAAQVGVETVARIAGDEGLADNILDEEAARVSADDGLTASIATKETPAGAQAKADVAEADAKAYADDGHLVLSSRVGDDVAELVGGLLPTSRLPALAIGTTTPVANQAEMLALAVQTGDRAVRSDFDPARIFVLAGADPTVLANWFDVTGTGEVQSVNGQDGVVVLGAADVGAPTVADLNTEETARADADVALAGDINDEEAARIAGDEAGQTAIDAEEIARGEADDALVLGLAGKQALSVVVVSGRGGGVLDDYPTIQAALDEVAAGGGGTVLLPDGTFMLSRPLVIDDNVILMGIGDATVVTRWQSVKSNITANYTAGQLVVTVADASLFTVGRGIYLRDNTANEWRYPFDAYITAINLGTNQLTLSVAGNVNLPTSNAPYALQAYPLIRNVNGATRMRVTNLKLDHNRLAGTDPVKADQAFTLSAISFIGAYESQVDSCRIINAVADFYSDQGNNGRDIPGTGANIVKTNNRFVHNNCYNAGLYGVHLGTEMEGAIVSHNVIDTTVDEAVHYSAYVRRTIATHNIVRNAGTYGFGSIDTRDTLNTIAYNVIDTCVNYGIDVAGGHDTLVVGNMIRNCTAGGIRIGGPSDAANRCKVLDNIIEQTTGTNSIEVRTGSLHTLIAGNTTNGGAAGARAVSVSASTYTRIVNNVFTNGAQGIFLNAAHNTLVRANIFDTFTTGNGMVRFETAASNDCTVEDNEYVQTTMTPINSGHRALAVRLVENGMGDNGATDPDLGGNWNAIETNNHNKRHNGRFVKWNDGLPRLSFFWDGVWTKVTVV